MSRRWPNTQHWQDIWKALDRISGKSRRRYGEWLFGLPPSGLRAHIDREDIPHEELVRLEDLIAAEFRELIAGQRKAMDDILKASREFNGQSAGRRFDVRTAEIKDINDYAEAFATQWCEKNVIGWKKEAA